MDFSKYARISSYEEIADLENDLDFAISPMTLATIHDCREKRAIQDNIVR